MSALTTSPAIALVATVQTRDTTASATMSAAVPCFRRVAARKC
jgi:hypothetical protein